MKVMQISSFYPSTTYSFVINRFKMKYCREESWLNHKIETQTQTEREILTWNDCYTCMFTLIDYNDHFFHVNMAVVFVVGLLSLIRITNRNWRVFLSGKTKIALHNFKLWGKFIKLRKFNIVGFAHIAALRQA